MDKKHYIKLESGEAFEPLIFPLDVWRSLDVLVSNSGIGLDDVLDWLICELESTAHPSLNS